MSSKFEAPSGSSIRARKVEEAVREVIAQKILRGLDSVPRGPVSITRAEATQDLSSVKVFFSVFPDMGIDVDDIQFALEDGAGILQREIATQLRLKLTPKLSFVLDTGFEKQLRMTQLMRDLESDRQKLQ